MQKLFGQMQRERNGIISFCVVITVKHFSVRGQGVKHIGKAAFIQTESKRKRKIKKTFKLYVNIERAFLWS